jgi:predicted O-methyltransferase YrrM
MRRLLRKLGAGPSASAGGAGGTAGRRPGPTPELVKARRKVRKLRQERNDLKRQLRGARATIREGVPELPERIEDVVSRVRAEHLTFLGAPNLRDLAALVLDLEKRGIPGSLIEAGTARGGSAIVMAAAKDPGRPMKVYDVFGMIPPPSERDGNDVHRRYATIAAGEAAGTGGEVYYGYRPDLLDEVTESFRRLGLPPAEQRIELIPGLFQDTIDLEEPVALAHLDGDWYESTMTCLERIAPLISPGGRIVLDDYYVWSGCRTAVDEYFAESTDFTLEFRARLHAVRH